MATTVPIHVTRHAAERYQQRIAPGITVDEAIARIETSAGAILTAAAFGCKAVLRGDGSKLILDGLTVVTVYVRPRR